MINKVLKINPVENGFIVVEEPSKITYGKEWVFNNSAALARFVDMYYNPILESSANESKNTNNQGE